MAVAKQTVSGTFLSATCDPLVFLASLHCAELTLYHMCSHQMHI